MRRSRCRAEGGVGGGYTPPIQDYSTRLAGNECRGGSRGLRPFRRGRWGEERRQRAKQAGRAIWSYVYAGPSAGGDLELRLCMFERRRWFANDMDLRLCMFQRGRPYGLMFSHVWAPPIVWSYVSACRSAGDHMALRLCMFERRRGLKVKKHEFECHMDLCLCIWERRWPYGLTFLHVRAPGGHRWRYGVTFLHV